MITFASCTQTQYDDLAVKDSNRLYFISDSKIIYKGIHPFSVNFKNVATLPVTGVNNTFYFDSTNSVLYYYDGSTFLQLANLTSLPTDIVNSINGQTGAINLSIPTKTSDLTNDSGFLTSAPVTSVNTQTGAVTITAADLGALTEHQSLANYSTTTEIQTMIATAIANITDANSTEY